MDQQFSQFSALTLSEKIQLVEDLWDSIAAEAEGLPLPEWQKAELDRRAAEYLRDPSLATPWEDAKRRILERHGR
jgi:putative addiction module component (TIGR02574 family)